MNTSAVRRSGHRTTYCWCKTIRRRFSYSAKDMCADFGRDLRTAYRRTLESLPRGFSANCTKTFLGLQAKYLYVVNYYYFQKTMAIFSSYLPSPSAWRVWIEINRPYAQLCNQCRSPSAWRVWIEILACVQHGDRTACVTLRMEGVDRNC